VDNKKSYQQKSDERKANRHQRQERAQHYSLLPPKAREAWQKEQDETQELEAVQWQKPVTSQE
jgi:hypothetical protein